MGFFGFSNDFITPFALVLRDDYEQKAFQSVDVDCWDPEIGCELRRLVFVFDWNDQLTKTPGGNSAV